jgi:8-oxo-dGTP pyrophosphatase MutT (NUDIX family)
MDKTSALSETTSKQSLCWQPAERAVVAAVCYRHRANGEIEFLLVRTRSGRWTFPKGGVDNDPSDAIAAAREAYEEAGVFGHVEPLAFTRYQHSKNGNHSHPVNAHLFRVLHLETPRENFRTPCWFSAEKAKRRLREERITSFADELDRVVDHAVRLVASGMPRPAFPQPN